MTAGSALKWTAIAAVLTLLATMLVMSMVTMVKASEHSVACDRATSVFGPGAPESLKACR